MSERPILFNDEMVRAILDGRKAQARRPIKPQPDAEGLSKIIDGPWEDTSGETYRCPFGVPGDRLWGREAFYVMRDLGLPLGAPQPLHYRVDVPDRRQVEDYVCKPSIHMPRWASRVTLGVERVWVERLQEISFHDAIAEGAFVGFDPPDGHGFRSEVKKLLADIWDAIYAKRGLGWDANPWVWACEFKVIEPKGEGE